jgi:Ca-activated chloride channel family protein
MNKPLIAALAALLIAVVLFSSCGAAPPPTRPASTPTGPQPTSTMTTGTTVPPATTTPGYIGLSAGGAKDAANFRENIFSGYLPLPSDITFEGLFYDYYFDTGSTEPARKLYSPFYSSAVTCDPLSGEAEYYLSVGLNSGLKADDFRRKKLNLVILLDNSGSMSEMFNRYYYDRNGRQVEAYADSGIYRQNKMESATESITGILDQLTDEDWFSIVTFNSRAYLNKPLGPVNEKDLREARNNVLDINAGGNTNLEAGLEMATRQIASIQGRNGFEYENRIIVLTDAQPNSGDFSASGLMGMLQANAANRIYTTFIGVGVDFNSQLIEEITRIKGANYYSVHSPRQFKQRIQEEFDYMVTPLVFDVNLIFESEGWRIEKVFGSPEADEATGRLMHINTLFASRADESGQVRGGLVLLKLRRVPGESTDIFLKTSYEDREGRKDGDSQAVTLEPLPYDYFENSGIRKGILLTRYAALMQNWLLDEWEHAPYSRPWDPRIHEDTGILLPSEPAAGQWERLSVPLHIHDGYRAIFQDFSRYFAAEAAAIGDPELEKELDILHRLSSH